MKKFYHWLHQLEFLQKDGVIRDPKIRRKKRSGVDLGFLLIEIYNFRINDMQYHFINVIEFSYMLYAMALYFNYLFIAKRLDLFDRKLT